MKILVAGFGNPLRRDDGFGVVLVARLEARADLPPGVELLEAGIGGISLVQELLAGYDGLVILDAREGGEPGDVRVLALEVADLSGQAPTALRETFADIHYAEPGRALALAKAVGSLPEKAFLVGCAPRSTELGEGLSPPVARALPRAERATLELLGRMVEDPYPRKEAGMELQGVGASAERKLSEIQTLVDYYDGEMGVLAGRLMLAVSFLRDARSAQDLSPEVKAAIEHSEALAVSVMTRILAEGGGCDCEKIEDEVQALLDRHGGAS